MKRFRVGDQVYCDAFGDGEVAALLIDGGARIRFGGNMVNFFSSGRVNRGFAGQELLNNAPIPIFFRHSGRRDNLERKVELIVDRVYRVRNSESQEWGQMVYKGELDGRHWFYLCGDQYSLHTYKLIEEIV